MCSLMLKLYIIHKTDLMIGIPLLNQIYFYQTTFLVLIILPTKQRYMEKLRQYATHLFTTRLSNVISDNKMSRLILTLTKQFVDNRSILTF